MTSGGVSISAATAADLEELAALEAVAFTHGWSTKALAGELRREEGVFLLARAEGSSTLAGYACWSRIEDEAELLRVAVAPRFRRRGVARRLLTEGLRLLTAAGGRSCYLEVRPDNHGAASLYRSLGFRREGRRRRYYRDGSAADVYLWEEPPRPPP